MEDWSSFEIALIGYRDLARSIRLTLYSYEKKIRSISEQMIKLDFEDSSLLFDRLYEIQNFLATALYKYEFPLNEKLTKFVYEFDRDDEYSRKYCYEKFLEDIEWWIIKPVKNSV